MANLVDFSARMSHYTAPYPLYHHFTSEITNCCSKELAMCENAAISMWQPVATVKTLSQSSKAIQTLFNCTRASLSVSEYLLDTHCVDILMMISRFSFVSIELHDSTRCHVPYSIFCGPSRLFMYL